MANTVVITGAASGIGRACAHEYARRGWRLGLVDRDRGRLTSAAGAARALGAEVAMFVVDLASAAEVDALAADLERAFDAVDVLINNAGVAVVKPLDRTTAEDWRWVFDVNVWAPIQLTRAVAPRMIARGRGQIAMVASLAGLVGAPGMVAYSTSKFAIVGFTEALRIELADTGVGLTLVCPGYVRTSLHAATRYANRAFERMLDAPPSWYGVTPEHAARQIVGGIDRRDAQVVFGIEKLGWYLKRLSPALGFALSRWGARRAGIVGAASRPVGPEARA